MLMQRLTQQPTLSYFVATLLIMGLAVVAPTVAWRAAVIVGFVEGCGKIARRLRGGRGRLR